MEVGTCLTNPPPYGYTEQVKRDRHSSALLQANELATTIFVPDRCKTKQTGALNRIPITLSNLGESSAETSAQSHQEQPGTQGPASWKSQRAGSTPAPRSLPTDHDDYLCTGQSTLS